MEPDMGKINWTKEQIDYLREHRTTPRKELTDMFNLKYETNYCMSCIKGVLQRNNIYSDTDGRFKKNNVPWDFGIRGAEWYAHYDADKRKEHMAKMHRKNATSSIGDELVFSGVPHIRIRKGHNKNILNSYERKSRFVYKQHYGEIPEGYYIIALDRNQMNTNIENLACIPNTYMRILAKNKWFSTDPNITKTAIKWIELHFAIKEL